MYKFAMLVITVLIINGCASSNLRVNKYVNTAGWEKVALMPVIGEYRTVANRKLTYQLASSIRFDAILPEYLEGDIERETRKRRVDEASLTLNNLVAQKYNADAFIHTTINASESGLGSKFTVFMKVVDIKNNQVFAMSKKEAQSYFNDEAVVEELIDEAVEEISGALSK